MPPSERLSRGAQIIVRRSRRGDIPEHWPMPVTARGTRLRFLSSETPIFEFALTDPEVRWLILDTHHNNLVLAGDLPPS
jgi:hypothetical protein